MPNRDIARVFIRDGLVSLIVLLFAYGAFDDITTDNATSFRFEYGMLAACALWLGSVGLRLLRLGHRRLGIASLAILGGALWGQRAIGPNPTPHFWPGYLITLGAFLWFLALAVGLLVRGSRTATAADR